MAYYNVLMTRDMTQSASIAVKAKNKSEAYEQAKDAVTESDWAADENYRDRGDIYLGDGLYSIGKIDKVEFERLTRPAPSAAPSHQKMTFDQIDALAKANGIVITDWLDKEMLQSRFPNLADESVAPILAHINIGDYDDGIDRDLTDDVIRQAAERAGVNIMGPWE